MAYPRYIRSKSTKIVNPAVGSTSINTASAWAALSAHIASYTDIELKESQAGDVIVVTFSGLWGNQAPYGSFDARTVVNGTLTNFISTGTTTAPASNANRLWYGHASVWNAIGGSFMYTLQASDISNGAVVVRPMVFTSGAKTWYHDPGQFTVSNIGPAQG